MKNYVPFPSSLKSIANFSFFGVRNLKAVEGFFMFSLPKFHLLLFYLMERTASATYNILQANFVVLVDIFEKILKKNATFEVALFPILSLEFVTSN